MGRGATTPARPRHLSAPLCSSAKQGRGCNPHSWFRGLIPQTPHHHSQPVTASPWLERAVALVYTLRILSQASELISFRMMWNARVVGDFFKFKILVFRIFRRLCNCHHYLILDHFLHPGKPQTQQQSLPSPHVPHPLATTPLLSVSLDWPVPTFPRNGVLQRVAFCDFPSACCLQAPPHCAGWPSRHPPSGR